MQNIRQQPMFVPDGNPDNTSEPEATWRSPGQIGAFHTVQQPSSGDPVDTETEEMHDKTYQLVRTDSSMTTAPFDGAVAWWANRARYRVTTDLTALGRGAIAGVFKRAWRAAGDLMFIQTEGPASVLIVDVPAAAPTVAGLFVIPSDGTNGDGKADVLAAGTAATYPILGTSAGPTQGGTGRAVVQLSVARTTP